MRSSSALSLARCSQFITVVAPGLACPLRGWPKKSIRATLPVTAGEMAVDSVPRQIHVADSSRIITATDGPTDSTTRLRLEGWSVAGAVIR